MWRYPFGSGGKRVTTSETLPSRTSAATISRMKSLRSGVAGLWALTPLRLIDSKRLASASPSLGAISARVAPNVGPGLCHSCPTFKEAPTSLAADANGVEHSFERSEHAVQPRVAFVTGAETKSGDEDSCAVGLAQRRNAVKLDPDDRLIVGGQDSAQGRKVDVVHPAGRQIGQAKLAAHTIAL